MWKRIINTEFIMRVAAKMIIIDSLWRNLEKVFDGGVAPSWADLFIFLILAYYVYKREKTRYEKQNV